MKTNKLKNIRKNNIFSSNKKTKKMRKLISKIKGGSDINKTIWSELMKEIEEFKKEEITTLQVYEDTPNTGIETVPCEIMHVVFNLLDGETMLNIPRVNRRFREVFNLFDKKILHSRVMSISHKNPEITDTNYLYMLKLLKQNKSLLPFKFELNTNYMPANLLFQDNGLQLISCLTNIKKLTLTSGLSVKFSMERGDEYTPIILENQRGILFGPNPDRAFVFPFDDDKLFRTTTNMFYLEELDISGCIKVTDVGMASLAAHCPNIKNLNISFCRNITINGILSVATNNNLRTLNINYSLIDDEGLKSIFVNCIRLTNVRFGFCENITIPGVMSIIGTRPIETIDLSGFQINDYNLQTLVPLLINLKHLIIYSCDTLMDIECLKNLINLETLDFWDTNRLEVGIDKFLESKPPKLKKFKLYTDEFWKSESEHSIKTYVSKLPSKPSFIWNGIQYL